jgi:hypothetical protein
MGLAASQALTHFLSGNADELVGRSRYAEESLAAAARIILHLHPLNSEGMILQYFVRINQHVHHRPKYASMTANATADVARRGYYRGNMTMLQKCIRGDLAQMTLIKHERSCYTARRATDTNWQSG